MGANFDRWTVLKLFEVVLVLICLIFKRVTDDEASRVFLYLQRISREWTLLNNITWSKVGAALADATYGGYLIITFALFVGRLFGELPTRRRISEYIFLGIGAILFIVLGSLSYAALDSVPQDLVDNAAVVGTVSLVTAGFFLLDMAGPKAKNVEAKREAKEETKMKQRIAAKTAELKSISQQVYDVEKQLEKAERKRLETFDKPLKQENVVKNGVKNGLNGRETERTNNNGYKQMRDDFPRKYGIYGKDGSETDDTEDLQMPPRMEPHSPVWSNIRKGPGENYTVVPSPLAFPTIEHVHEEYRPPSRPGDPGYVQYTAQHWGEPGTKTPRHSPTEV